jgi:predicted nucleic acid-binding protein
LFVLAELDNEYLTNPRLQNKFEWVNTKEYKQDRETKKYTCRGTWASAAETAFSFLVAYARQQTLVLAPEDLKALAVGFARKFPVVSDDGALRKVAETHDIPCLGTLELLKLMTDAGRITAAKVTEILEYLDHENDLPMGKPKLRAQYQEVFGQACPLH